MGQHAPLIFWDHWSLSVWQLITPHISWPMVWMALSLDIVEATYLLPPLDVPASTKHTMPNTPEKTGGSL